MQEGIILQYVVYIGRTGNTQTGVDVMTLIILINIIL